MSKKRLIIIDGSYCIYRAFHAIPHFANSEGTPTNATYGFTQTLRKIIKDYSPDYIAVAFDVKGPTFRHEKYEDYKADRPPMPDDLSAQIPYIRRIVDAFNITSLEAPGFEADDIIATVARKAKEWGVGVAIISGDKDLYQLVDNDTVILDYTKDKEFDPEGVKEKFGVRPDQILDLLSLAGDSSDGIPGVPGVGPKTAKKLLDSFDNFDNIFENVDDVQGKGLKEKLKNNKELAELSRELATLRSDIELGKELADMEAREVDGDSLGPLLKELDFAKLYNELMPETKAQSIDCELIKSSKELAASVKKVRAEGSVAIYPLFIEKGARQEPLGLALSLGSGDGGEAFYIPLELMDSKDGFAPSLKDIFTDAKIKKTIDDSKSLYGFLLSRGVELEGLVMDTSLASYLLNPSANNHTIEQAAFSYLDKKIELVKKPGELSEVERGLYAGLRAMIAGELGSKFMPLLKEEGLLKLFSEMELPLSKVLARMELVGIKVDKEILTKLSKELDKKLKALEKDIYALAGGEFNINSPKQLSKLLFEDMGIKPVKKTKTGFSTDEGVLKVLSQDYELPEKILSFRQLAKLKSTYVDAILALADDVTGRVHTTFNQTVTATGRLSSSKPNLQNIPVRDEYSARIRRAFIADKGTTFLSADYSQIELRLVAHLSGDPALLRAFKEGADIHTATASEVFEILPGLVTSELRRRAKAINFGIIYGMGAFGLATDLDISVKEAGDYIEEYFAYYSRVKEFIDETVSNAARDGYTETIYGRKRFIPELSSKAQNIRRLGERMAMNTPIQGSAADMIKAAMLKIDERMHCSGLKSRMILQIHDELFFEVADGEMEALEPIVIEEMTEVIKLKVPVVVNVKRGADWSSVD